MFALCLLVVFVFACGAFVACECLAPMPPSRALVLHLMGPSCLAPDSAAVVSVAVVYVLFHVSFMLVRCVSVVSCFVSCSCAPSLAATVGVGEAALPA